MKTWRKEPVGRPRHRWEDNIKTDLKELGCEVVKWIQLARNRVQKHAIIKKVMSFLKRPGVY
jgi:hypothetical protein